MAIKDHYDEIAHCNHCGFCQVACPIFRSTGHESGVARGRLALLRAVIEGRLEWSRELEEPLFDCLLCGACTSSCFPAIPTSDLVIKARSEYLEKVGRKSIHRLLFDQLLPYPRRLHLAARAVALGKNTGTSRLARALGLLRIFGRDLAQAEDIVERLPAQPFRARFKPGSYPGQGQSLRIAYFVGCGVDIVSQAAGEATLALLKRFAKSVDIIENNCCGLPAWSYGDLEAARRLATKNLPLLASGEHDVIITDCSSCASFLKKYPALFAKDDAGLQEAAQAAAKRVRDVSEWLLEAAAPSSLLLRGKRVTFHDPCHASRGQKLVKPPREILHRIPGAEFVELPEADWCCGGAGSYAMSHFDLAMQVLDRKMGNLKKTGAEVLVTTCPACIIQLSYGVRRHGLKVDVRHLTEII